PPTDQGVTTVTVRVAINGLGRIGRLVMRAAHEAKRDDIEVVAINDLGSVHANAHLLKHDSVHGKFPGTITTGPDWMDVGHGKIRVIAERDPAKLPWKELKVDVALECTVVLGVNSDQLKSSHTVISNGSCTTNCLAPVAYVLNEGVGIEHGFMTTIHSFTGDQSTVDTLHKDLRRARAASLSMIPTSTGAAKAMGLVMPSLHGKLDGTSVRVPTADVSLVDLVVTTSRKTSKDEINKLMTDAANSNRFKGILGVTDEELVSVDFVHDPRSSIFDLTQTTMMGDRFARVLSWYDNEWGFSNRMVEAAALVGK